LDDLISVLGAPQVGTEHFFLACHVALRVITGGRRLHRTSSLVGPTRNGRPEAVKRAKFRVPRAARFAAALGDDG
jgi:hypothetical protein